MVSILKGDCLQIMKSLPDKSVDCFICDLPYGCLMLSWDFKIDLNEFWIQVKRLSKDDHTPVLMFCNTKFGYDLIQSNPRWFRYDLVWNKHVPVGHLQANKQPMRSHEMIYVFSKKGASYKRIDYIGDFPNTGGRAGSRVVKTIYGFKKQPLISPGNTGKRCVSSVITSGHAVKQSNHPTEKPMELYEWLLRRYAPANGLVLDPTAGSFNSIAVAKMLNLRAIGIEKDTDFFTRAVKRFTETPSKTTQQQPTALSHDPASSS
jgi:site-specific DNA-methyltransferase (adenine-specific)